NTVTPIAIPAGKPGPPITVGHIPTALAVTRDGRTLYVADNNDQNVLPVDIATRAPGRPIRVGRYLMAPISRRSASRIRAERRGARGDAGRAHRVAEWSARGAEFLTKPKDHGREIRACIRDPDGHLIEVGQTT
ncbi:MAG TPA: hypothetical protein VN961_24520, partial [Streptosporangiaceae bacterium]|nr:hypothetical protein [Streptosporangiaceae bacterium]